MVGGLSGCTTHGTGRARQRPARTAGRTQRAAVASATRAGRASPAAPTSADWWPASAATTRSRVPGRDAALIKVTGCLPGRHDRGRHRPRRPRRPRARGGQDALQGGALAPGDLPRAARPSAAIVHVHPPYCAACAVAGRDSAAGAHRRARDPRADRDGRPRAVRIRPAGAARGRGVRRPGAEGRAAARARDDRGRPRSRHGLLLRPTTSRTPRRSRCWRRRSRRPPATASSSTAPASAWPCPAQVTARHIAVLGRSTPRRARSLGSSRARPTPAGRRASSTSELSDRTQALADVDAAAVAGAAGGEPASAALRTATGRPRHGRDGPRRGAAAGRPAARRASSRPWSAVGGNQGTAIAATAMRDAADRAAQGDPLHRRLRATSAAVRGRRRHRHVFSVGDLLGGPNAVIATSLDQACRRRRRDGRAAPGTSRPRPAARRPHRVRQHPPRRRDRHHHGSARRPGATVVPFHASGACGSAMERLIDAGRSTPCWTLTTHELLGELYPFDIYAPVRPGRLTPPGKPRPPAGGRCPADWSTSASAPPDSIPAALRDRPTHHHNPYNTNVAHGGDELRTRRRPDGRPAERPASGPVAVLIPTRGWSQVGRARGSAARPGRQRRASSTSCAQRPATPIAVRELDADHQRSGRSPARQPRTCSPC